MGPEKANFVWGANFPCNSVGGWGTLGAQKGPGRHYTAAHSYRSTVVEKMGAREVGEGREIPDGPPCRSKENTYKNVVRNRVKKIFFKKKHEGRREPETKKLFVKTEIALKKVLGL